MPLARTIRTGSRLARFLSATAAILVILTAVGCGACAPSDRPEQPADNAAPARRQGPRNDLDTMDTAHLEINDHRFEVWIADEHDTRQTGLMNVEQDELAPLDNGTHRGMLFVFPREQLLSFWMKNTLIPLDIAYINDDGRIIRTYTMAAGETRSYPSGRPARYALEVSAGLFQKLDIRPGQRVELPDLDLKGDG